MCSVPRGNRILLQCCEVIERFAITGRETSLVLQMPYLILPMIGICNNRKNRFCQEFGWTRQRSETHYKVQGWRNLPCNDLCRMSKKLVTAMTWLQNHLTEHHASDPLWSSFGKW
jgi:hypothetical protein